jgi:hypothetical protein
MITHEGEFDVELNDWPKRRRAMIALLKNPWIPIQSRPYLYGTAESLIRKLEVNGHPMCASKVRDVLNEVKKNARRT